MGPGADLARIHSLLGSLGKFQSMEALASEILRFLGQDPGQAVSPPLAEALERGLVEWLRLELPESLAAHMHARLKAGPPGTLATPQPLWTYLCQRAIPYLNLLSPWVSLWVAYAYTALAACRNRGVGDMFVLGRDGLVFYLAAVELVRKLGWPINVAPLELNRRLLGLDGDSAGVVADAARPTVKVSRDLVEYLETALKPPRRVALVDSGYYGTIPWALHRLRLPVDIMALYYSSRNPNLFGFLNTLVAFGNLRGVVVSYDFIILAGDTVEAALKPYRVEHLSRTDSGVGPAGRVAPLLPAFMALASYWLVGRWAAGLDLAGLDPWQQLLSVHNLCQVKGPDGWPVPLLLPEPTPKWSLGPRWLQDWSLGPIPPMDDICGPRPG